MGCCSSSKASDAAIAAAIESGSNTPADSVRAPRPTGEDADVSSSSSASSKVVPMKRARSHVNFTGSGISPVRGRSMPDGINRRDNGDGPNEFLGGVPGGLARQRSRQRPGMAAHMSRKKLVKTLLLMFFKDAASENNGSAKLDHVTFRDMYVRITSIGGRRVPQATTIRHLMIFLDKKHDPSQIMEFEVVGSIMRAVEVVLVGEQDDEDVPEMLMHLAKCLVNRVELMAVALHELFIEYADPAHSPPCIDAGGMYKLLKGVLKKNKKYKPSRDETKVFMTFMDGDGDGVVSEKEFVSYMCVGMCMTKRRRKKFKKKSDMHKKLVKFLAAVSKSIEDSYQDIEKQREAIEEEELSLLLSYGAG